MDTSDKPISVMSAIELIESLDAAYPHHTILKGQSLEDAHRYAGRRDVIDELLSVLAMEKEGYNDDEEDEPWED